MTENGNERLLVIFMGWACDAAPVKHIEAESYDILCVYDYRDIGEVLDGRGGSFTGLLTGYLKRYVTRTLMAWSFGVWAAERLFGAGGSMPIEFNKAIALNGTPFPADDQYGIGERRLAVTVRGLARGVKDEFDRKSYGKWHEQLESQLSPRPLEENIKELDILTARSREPFTPLLEWNTAVIGTEDLIFPPENMHRYWADKALSARLPHYPFGEREFIKDLL